MYAVFAIVHWNYKAEGCDIIGICDIRIDLCTVSCMHMTCWLNDILTEITGVKTANNNCQQLNKNINKECINVIMHYTEFRKRKNQISDIARRQVGMCAWDRTHLEFNGERRTEVSILSYHQIEIPTTSTIIIIRKKQSEILVSEI